MTMTNDRNQSICGNDIIIIGEILLLLLEKTAEVME